METQWGQTGLLLENEFSQWKHVLIEDQIHSAQSVTLNIYEPKQPFNEQYNLHFERNVMWLTVWYCQFEGITPICWRLFSFLSALTAVDSTVGCRNRSNAEFIKIWRFLFAGCSPFILPLSVSSIFDLTSESDPLSSVYFRPVWLQSHNSLVWNCSCSRIHSEETKMTKS